MSPPSLLPGALSIPGHTARSRDVCGPLHPCPGTPSGSGLPHPRPPALTGDRGHQRAQPLVLLLQGSADFPHVLQALGAKGKRPIQCCISENLPDPTSPSTHTRWVWYLFRAGRCMLGGSQSVLGCLTCKTQRGKMRYWEQLLIFSEQGGRTLSLLCPLLVGKQAARSHFIDRETEAQLIQSACSWASPPS